MGELSIITPSFISNLKNINEQIDDVIYSMKIENRVPSSAHLSRLEFETSLSKIIRSDLQTLHYYIFGDVIDENNIIQGLGLCTVLGHLSKYTYQKIPDILKIHSGYFLACEYDRPILKHLIKEFFEDEYRLFDDLEVIILTALQTLARSRYRKQYSNTLLSYSEILMNESEVLANDNINKLIKANNFIYDYEMHKLKYEQGIKSNINAISNETKKIFYLD